jgi:nickel-dependent lactate racemase
MRTTIAYGRAALEVELDTARVLELRRHATSPPLADPAAAVRDALEAPRDHPALRRSLTPEDHVAVIVDESLPRLGELLTPILEQIVQAGVAPEAITLLCPPSSSGQKWIDELPKEFEEVRLETHDPGDRKHLSYLAATKQGKRVYLNRTAVDADQLILLSGRRYDPVLGVSGCEGALYPTVSDEATLHDITNRVSLDAPGEDVWPLRKEAAEVAWLLGAPFVVQIIEGEGDSIAQVVAGPVSTSAEGQRHLDARWRMSVPYPAETVIASISGDSGRCRFEDLAGALVCAARVVKAGGRIILLSEAEPRLDAGAAILRQAEDPESALALLADKKAPDWVAAYQWANTAAHAHIYLLSRLPAEVVEELFATPLEDRSQVQRLLRGEGPFLFIPDANKALVEVAATPVQRPATKKARTKA